MLDELHRTWLWSLDYTYKRSNFTMTPIERLSAGAVQESFVIRDGERYWHPERGWVDNTPRARVYNSTYANEVVEALRSNGFPNTKAVPVIP